MTAPFSIKESQDVKTLVMEHWCIGYIRVAFCMPPHQAGRLPNIFKIRGLRHLKDTVSEKGGITYTQLSFITCLPWGIKARHHPRWTSGIGRVLQARVHRWYLISLSPYRCSSTMAPRGLTKIIILTHYYGSKAIASLHACNSCKLTSSS